MMEAAKRPEVSETKPPAVESFKGIKPQEGTTPKEAQAYWDEQFNNSELPSDAVSRDEVEPADGHCVPFKDRLDHTPHDNTDRGSWDGERGDSKFIPSEETDAGRVAKEKLAEKNMDGVEYKDAEPDFSECAEATVVIDNMTENRDDYLDTDGNYQPGNFSQADAKCAEQWNTSQKDGRSDWTAADVRDWRRENNCSWHERCDTCTMDLVSRDIHGFFTHSGGVAECKARDAVDLGGGFDE